jgi:pimeloyl-ACP methyl ester carboxylesterase
MAHSAGAAIIARIAWEYPEIKKLLLVNTAFKMNPDNILSGLAKYTGTVRFVFGSKDPSIDWAKKLKEKYEVTIIEGADHNFSNEYIETFIELPTI